MAPSVLLPGGLFLLVGAQLLAARLEPYDLLYDSGVQAYYREDWPSVILSMEKALRNRELLRRNRITCRMQCANTSDYSTQTAGWGPVQDLRFFQRVLERADCVRSCERHKMGAPSTYFAASEELELEFRKRSPYNYLQVAYFKIHKLDKAVAAAHTFFMGNPDHMEMRQNLEYYKMMAGVSDSDFRDLEAKPHMQDFRLGVRYYTDEESGTAITYFEKALEEYLVADVECRSLCEGPYDYDGYNFLDYSADLFQSITDHYVQVMSCRQGCVSELATQPGKDKPIEDFLASHFNYLQFAYYNIENYTKAIECAKTYLLFHPNDEVMTQNLAYYSAVLGEDAAALIQPREDFQAYITRSLLEKELLYFAYDVFGIPFVDPDTWTPESVIPKRLKEKQRVERETAARISEEIGNLMKEIENLVEEKTKETFDLSNTVREGGPVLFDEVSVVMTSKTLNGSQRVVTDGVISEDECRELLRLTNAAASAGDGYRGTTSPHTPNEKFHGVTVYKALKLGQEGKVPLKSAHLYYNVTEKVRRVVESYFRLDSPLYFSYSHLVCRTAIEEKQDDRQDLSHPVHADNCILKAEAMMCVKEHPAYTFRDYSAILYLNGDFEGGQFYFTELDAKTITAEIKPQCGRMVGFSSGAENPHGVKAVTKGQRCAVALWFTLDPRHNERERIQADDLIKMLFGPEETNVFPGNESVKKSETRDGVVTPPEPPTGPDSDPPKEGVLGPPLDSPKTKTEL
ncbi:prolyl 3-hydroxylase 1 [Dendrobates tinctorius]|uniref:prolyl 3-hydroxylase 1 n=1 Tax=Dendrobates tinctorius TaxID=92724 RepID=UPI003CC9876B